MQLNILEQYSKELLIIFNVILGLFVTINIENIITVIINILLTFLILYYYLQQQFNNKKTNKYQLIIANLRILLIALQYGLNPNNVQSGIMIIYFLEDKQTILKFAILLNLGISNVKEQEYYNNITELPYNILYFVTCLFVLLFSIKNFLQKDEIVKLTQPQFQEIQKKHSLDNPPTFHIKSQEILSMKKHEESKSQIDALSGSDIKPLALNSNHQEINEDDLIVGNMSWISNQSVLVYNFELNIVYQTFYLGKLQKNMGDKIDCEQLFLDSTIMIACKEITDLQGQSAAYSDSIFSDGSFLCNNLNEAVRCKVKGQYTLRELGQTLYKDYDKWKFFTLTIFKLKNDLIDLDGIQVKLYLNTIENHKFILFILEQTPSPLKLQSSEIHTTLINIYQTFLHEAINYVNCIQTYLLLLTSHMENNYNISSNNNNTSNATNHRLNTKDDYTNESLFILRDFSQKYTLFLGCMKDYVFYFSNSLFFKMNHVKIEELLDSLLVIYEPILQLKKVRLTTNIDLQEGNSIVYNDQERIKQIISCLINYCLSSSFKSNIRLDVKSYTLQGFMFTIRDTKTDFNEEQKKKIQDLIKLLTTQLKNQRKDCELDLTNPLELQICIILCWQLSGSLKRGLEFIVDSSGYSTFTFVVENSINQIKNQNGNESGPIKVLGRKKYFETSISLLLQENMNSGDSKYLSLSQLSKQFSIKPSEPIDLQSAYFSQISKIREASNSKGIPNSATIHKSREQSGSFSGTYKQQINSDSIQQITKILNKNNISIVGKIESPNESQRTHSLIDFGGDQSSTPIVPPNLSPKFLTSVIKFKLRSTCCPKVLILDSDPFSILALDKVLQKFDIKSEYAFNGIEAQELIQIKQENPCHCKNKHYLLYFIDINIPNMNSIDFVQQIKKQIQDGFIDKAFFISTGTVVDVNTKVNSFKSGIDYFIQKPFDLIEIIATVQYLDF